jgi:putative ABC transport system ATP-binding protein
MLRLQHLTLAYNVGRADQLIALNQIDVTFPDGQFCTIVGSNGAGKSSLLRVIAGFETPTDGRVFLRDQDLTHRPDYKRARLVGYVFDNPSNGTVAELSIEENLGLAMHRGSPRGLAKAVTNHRRRRMREALSVFELGLETRLRDRAGLLSAGQRQSLTMAMAALTEPEVLLLDEHLASLDPNTQLRVLRLTAAVVHRLGCTTLMVTHNIRHALEYGDRLIVMADGRIVGDFTGAVRQRLTVDDVAQSLRDAGNVLPDRSFLG